MSKGAQPVSVKILDKEYLVACTEDERAELLASADYLSRKMKEIRDTGKVVGADRMAVMAALNIAHEMVQLKVKKPEYHQSMGTRIRAIQDKIEVALNKGKQLEL